MGRRGGYKKLTDGTTERPQKLYPDPNRGTKQPVSGRCGYPLSNGRFCANWPLKKKGHNITGCRLHHGKMQQSVRTHGLYSKHQPKHIADQIERALEDPRLLDMRQQVAMISVLLAEAWSTIHKRMDEDLERASTDLEKELASRLLNNEVAMIVTLSDKVSTMIERTARVGVAMKLMVSLDTLNQILEMFVDIASGYVTDEKKRRKFIAELQSRADTIVDNDDTTFAELMKRRPQLDSAEVTA